MSRSLVAFLLLVATPAFSAPRVLTLDEALRAAEARQPQLRAARAQVRVGQARTGEAYAGFLPRLDGSAQYQRSTANFLLSPAFAASGFFTPKQLKNDLSPESTVNYYLFGLTATQLVYDFGKTGGTYAEAREAENQARADYENTAEQVALAVRVAYFNVLAAKELVWVGEETVKNQGKHVEQVRNFVSAGTRPKIDLRTSELNLADAQLNLVRARNQLDLAKVALNNAMGVEGPIDYDVVEPAGGPAPDENATAQDLIDTAMRSRPEVRRLLAQVRAVEASRKVAQSGYLPQLLATGNLSGTKVSDTKVGDFDWATNWYFGVALNWNLFSGLLTTKQVEEADAQVEALLAQRDSLRQSIRAELEQQLLAVAEAKERLRVTESAVGTADERLKLAEGRYQAGAGDILELDDAQVAQANAKAQRVAAQYDLAIARARLTRAVGRK